MVLRLGVKDSLTWFSALAVWLQLLMPLLGCPNCREKWAAEEGGVCPICRTLDRLAVVIRGPELPAIAGGDILRKLRLWVAEAQDIGEAARGVVPDPLGFRSGSPRKEKKAKASKVPKGKEEKPKEKSEEHLPGPSGSQEVQLRVEPGPPGAKSCGKAKPPSPPSGVTPGVEENTKEAETVKAEEPSEEVEKTPEEKKTRRKRRAEKSSSSERRKKKRSKKSRSPGRSPIRRRSQGRHSRGSGAAENPPAAEVEPEEDSRRQRDRSRRPREPSYPPPRRGGAAASSSLRPSSRPVRGGHVGPIYAQRREPAPGTGKHFGKYKGKGKEIRNDHYWDWRRSLRK